MTYLCCQRRFANYNYTDMLTAEGEPSGALLSKFADAVRVAFLTGVAQQTSMHVTSEGNALQVGRVSVTSIKPGECRMQGSFTADG